ncbi:MAG: hypothetical protein AAGJ80_02970 [Cyanobacteria bacterium J06553_1]
MLPILRSSRNGELTFCGPWAFLLPADVELWLPQTHPYAVPCGGQLKLLWQSALLRTLTDILDLPADVESWLWRVFSAESPETTPAGRHHQLIGGLAFTHAVQTLQVRVTGFWGYALSSAA